jgi:hypothetical protein
MPLAAASRDDVLGHVPTLERPAKKPETVLDLLLKLDCFLHPGITHDQFKTLFVQCRCGLATTRRAFKRHTCVQVQTTIDLTMNSDGNDSQ